MWFVLLPAPDPDLPTSRTCSIDLKLSGSAALRQNPYQGPRFRYHGLGPYNTRKSKDVNNQFWLYYYEIVVTFPNGVRNRGDWHFEAEVNYLSRTSALINGAVTPLPVDSGTGENDTPFDQNTGWIGNALYAVDMPALSQWDGTFTYSIVEGTVTWEFTWRVKIGNNTICERKFQMQLTVPLDGDKAGVPSWVIVP